MRYFDGATAINPAVMGEIVRDAACGCTEAEQMYYVLEGIVRYMIDDIHGLICEMYYQKDALQSVEDVCYFLEKLLED